MVFVATANVVDTIPGPLLDRMEVVALDGYTEAEKVAIARDHLLARQLDRNAAVADEVALTDAALAALVADHTREAGVRQLERALGKLLRKVATSSPPATSRRPCEVDADGPCAPGSGGPASAGRPPSAPGARGGDRPGGHRRRRRRALGRGGVDARGRAR